MKTSPKFPGPSRPILSDLRVLLVEDDPEGREVCAMLLEAHGAEVRRANTAASALEALEVERFDVLVSDIGLPDVDGCKLIGEIRRREADRGGATPAVALTAFGGGVDRERALAAGFDAFAAKPIRSDELASMVAILARRLEECRVLYDELCARAETHRSLLVELERLIAVNRRFREGSQRLG